MWVYTETGQRQAELHGNKNRKAGEQAMIGYKPVDGVLAKAWARSGYIQWIDDEVIREEKRNETEGSDS